IWACRSRSMGNLFDSPDEISLMSAPARNIPWAPVSTSASTAGSEPASFSASASPSRTLMLVAFTGGLSISRTAIFPSRRYFTADTEFSRNMDAGLHAIIFESLHCVSMDTVDAVVIGAGVVGLAVARALAMRGLETLILEAREQFGTGMSSRNSEVVHAGIYYPRGSLKARLCVAGRDLLYPYCEQYGVAHRRCGKLIVAT